MFIPTRRLQHQLNTVSNVFAASSGHLLPECVLQNILFCEFVRRISIHTDILEIST